MKFKVIILRNELDGDHSPWVTACEQYKEIIEYKIVNLTSNSWLEQIQMQSFDILLAKPGGLTAPFKQLYDERIYILSVTLGYKVFPSALEIYLYENKRFLSYWLKANNITHPSTMVFYEKEEAIRFLDESNYPLVAKTNIGASGSGVQILKTRNEAFTYINDTFKKKGSPQRIGPNLKKGKYLKRIFHYFLHPSDIARKINIYSIQAANIQKGFLIFQDYIPHYFEWRVVRIGDSFFAHKKLKIGDKSSGSLIKEYDNPPFSLLDFTRDITDKFRFYSLAIDIFESEGGYLVNEIQCIFGQSDPYQMLVNKKPGRYRYLEGDWIFEEGLFNSNQSYNLRLEYVISLLEGEKME